MANDMRDNPVGGMRQGSSPVVPFLLGTAVGAAAGAVVGTLFSRYGIHLVAAMIGAVDRRISRDERDQLRFELLLQ